MWNYLKIIWRKKSSYMKSFSYYFDFRSILLRCKPTHGYSVKMPCRSFDFPVWLEAESFWKLDLEKWEMDLATGLVLPTDRNLGRPWIPSNCHSIFLPRLKFKVLIFCFNIRGPIQTLYQPLEAEVQKPRSNIQIFCSGKCRYQAQV